jgi:hypothetical protein
MDASVMKTPVDRVISIVFSQLPAGVAVKLAELRRHYMCSTEITHWELTYTQETAFPARVVAKWSDHPSRSTEREAQFYTMMRERACSDRLAQMGGYEAFPEGELLVLEDKSPEFGPAMSTPSVPPALHRNVAVFDALRAVHCDLWDDPKTREFPIDMLATHQAKQLTAQRDLIHENLRSRPGLPPTTPGLLTRLTDRLPELRRGVLSRANALTIIHGDAHPGNALVSESTVPCRAILIDWPNWQPGIPTDDLAYYLSLCFPPAERSRQEPELLQHYFDGLPPRVRESYPRQQFESDFRVSLARCLATAFLWIACPSPPQWAWGSLDFVLDAWRAWDGETVL